MERLSSFFYGPKPKRVKSPLRIEYKEAEAPAPVTEPAAVQVSQPEAPPPPEAMFCIQLLQSELQNPSEGFWEEWTKNYQHNIIKINTKKKQDYARLFVKKYKEALLAENSLIQFYYDRVPVWINNSKVKQCTTTDHNNMLSILMNEIRYEQADPTIEPTREQIRAAYVLKFGKEPGGAKSAPVPKTPRAPRTPRAKSEPKQKAKSESKPKPSTWQLDDRANQERLKADAARRDARMKEKKGELVPPMQDTPSKSKTQKKVTMAPPPPRIDSSASPTRHKSRGGGAGSKARFEAKQAQQQEDDTDKGPDIVDPLALSAEQDTCYDDNQKYMTSDIVRVDEYQAAKSACLVFKTLEKRADLVLEQMKTFGVADAKQLIQRILTKLGELKGSARDVIKELIMFQVYKLGSMNLAARKENPFLNMALYGKAGTGKTVLAQTIAYVYGASGILLYDTYVEYTAKDLTGAFLGESGKIMASKLINGLEQIVFIDEAYSIVSCMKNKQTNQKEIDHKGSQYGMESIAELLKFTDVYRGKQVIIVAGYINDMQTCFFGANEGLPRRFPLKQDLLDYDAEGLTAIFERNVNLALPGPGDSATDATANVLDPGPRKELLAFLLDKFKEGVADKLFLYQGGDMLNLAENFLLRIDKEKIRKTRAREPFKAGVGFNIWSIEELKAMFNKVYAEFKQERVAEIAKIQSDLAALARQSGQPESSALSPEMARRSNGGRRTRHRKLRRHVSRRR